jgi:hypothetical protein
MNDPFEVFENPSKPIEEVSIGTRDLKNPLGKAWSSGSATDFGKHGVSWSNIP